MYLPTYLTKYVGKKLLHVYILLSQADVLIILSKCSSIHYTIHSNRKDLQRFMETKIQEEAWYHVHASQYITSDQYSTRWVVVFLKVQQLYLSALHCLLYKDEYLLHSKYISFKVESIYCSKIQDSTQRKLPKHK